MIRQATKKDASRIAEILVFSKRVNYRRIFENDAYSFLAPIRTNWLCNMLYKALPISYLSADISYIYRTVSN